MRTTARILIAAILLPYFLVPIQTVSADPSFEFDGTFVQNVIQTNASARTETKAAFGITIGDASHGILAGSHWFYLDGTRILFSPG